MKFCSDLSCTNESACHVQYLIGNILAPRKRKEKKHYHTNIKNNIYIFFPSIYICFAIKLTVWNLRHLHRMSKCVHLFCSLKKLCAYERVQYVFCDIKHLEHKLLLTCYATPSSNFVIQCDVYQLFINLPSLVIPY